MSPARPRILIVDDSPANLHTLGRALAVEFELFIANSGQSGLNMAAEVIPDIILLDAVMSDMDGFEVCRRLKADETLKFIPVVFITGLEGIEAEAKALELGAIDFLTKPVNINIARRRIQNLVLMERLRRAAIEGEERLRLLGDNLKGAGLYIYSHDTNGDRHFEFLSAGVEVLCGVSASEAMQNASLIHSLILPEYIPRLIELEAQSRAQLSSFEIEIEQRNAATEDIRWMWLRSTPVLREDGSTVWYGVQVDITERKQTEDALRSSEAKLDHLITNMPIGLCLVDADGRIYFRNDHFLELFGYTADEVPSLTEWWEKAYPDEVYRDQVMDRWNRAVERATRTGDDIDAAEYRVKSASGEEKIILISGIVVGNQFLATFVDQTGQRHAQEKLGLAASVFTHAREGIMITDPDGCLVEVNRAFEHITGYNREEAIGRNPAFLASGRHGAEFFQGMWKELHEKGYWYGELWNRRKNGEVFALLMTISAVRSTSGDVQHFVALFSDITSIKEHENQLEHIAHYDALTGLPNRSLLGDRLRQAMTQSSRRDQRIAVAYFDLDGFKAINDSYGHDAGDRLLMAMAGRMKQVLREGDTLARLGGDEFVAILIDLVDHQACIPVLIRLLHAASQPFYIDDIPMQVSVSIGITFYPQEGEIDADQLLRQADRAMYQAKVAGKNRYHIFEAGQDFDQYGPREILDQLKQALSDGAFELYYQPRVNMQTGEVTGLEALIRWNHPDRGLLAPGNFLPYIAGHRMIVEMGEWTLDSALKQLASWQKQGFHLPVSVNIAAHHLQQVDFIERLGQILSRYPDISTGMLELEIVEAGALENMDHAFRVIQDCQQLGISFTLDDFGTGYSSLTYLKVLPAKSLKVDQNFVRNMLDEPDDLATLEGVIGLAGAFHRQVIAEGVETREHGEMLLMLGCTVGQGYGIAYPMPADSCLAWMSDWKPAASWRDCTAVRREYLPALFAIVEHRVWIAAIEAYLNEQRLSPPLLDPHECRLGRWLHGEAVQTHNGDLGSLLLLHAEMHSRVDELLEIRSSGDPEQARKRMKELHDLRGALFTELRHMIA